MAEKTKPTHTTSKYLYYNKLQSKAKNETFVILTQLKKVMRNTIETEILPNKHK